MGHNSRPQLGLWATASVSTDAELCEKSDVHSTGPLILPLCTGGAAPGWE